MNLEIRKQRLKLERTISKCSSCDLHKYPVNEITKVFGNGNCLNPKVFMIGLAPSWKSDSNKNKMPHRKKGGTPRAFQHHHGFTFRNMLKTIGLYDMVYITNLLKCSTPKNREPKEVERQACLQWLEREFKLFQPGFIVAMSSSTYDFLERISVVSESGCELFGIQFQLRKLYHPNYCLSYHRITKEEYLLELMALKRWIEK